MTNTAIVSTKSNRQLAQLDMFSTMTLPKAAEGICVLKNTESKTEKDAQGNAVVIGQTFTTLSRKDVAKALELSTKKDGAEIDRRILAATDALKPQIAAVCAKLANDPSFTGGNIVARQTKSGLKVGLFFRKVDRKVTQVNPVDAAKALIAAGKSEEEAIQIVTDAIKAEFAALGTVNVEATATPAPAPAAEAAPTEQPAAQPTEAPASESSAS